MEGVATATSLPTERVGAGNSIRPERCRRTRSTRQFISFGCPRALVHVNARHTAEQMSKGQLTQGIVGIVSIVAGTQSSIYGNLASQLGQVGAGARAG